MLEAVSEIHSCWKSRLCWSVINHRRECRKRRGKAVLASIALRVCWSKVHLQRSGGDECVCVVSAGKQHYSLGTPTTCAHRRKTNAAGAKGSALVTASAQQHRKMNARVLLLCTQLSFSTVYVDCRHPQSQKEDTEVCLLAKVRREWNEKYFVVES